jgi:hypothetical protein
MVEWKTQWPNLTQLQIMDIKENFYIVVFRKTNLLKEEEKKTIIFDSNNTKQSTYTQ